MPPLAPPVLCTKAGCGAYAEPSTARCAVHRVAPVRPFARRRTPTAPLGRAWRRTVQLVLERDAGVCHLCHRPGATSADHVVARALGGSDSMSNLRAVHPSCNARKAQSEAAESRRRREGGGSGSSPAGARRRPPSYLN
ncbi:MAG: HNH endonuclease [Dehalococcoidia bacterium]